MATKQGNVPMLALGVSSIVVAILLDALAYKRLAAVERAFRCLKSVDLNVRPIHHRLPDRVLHLSHVGNDGF